MPTHTNIYTYMYVVEETKKNIIYIYKQILYNVSKQVLIFTQTYKHTKMNECQWKCKKLEKIYWIINKQEKYKLLYNTRPLKTLSCNFVL